MNPLGRPHPARGDLGSAITFLTPFGGRRAQLRPTPATMAYFPVVGASLGALDRLVVACRP